MKSRQEPGNGYKPLNSRWREHAFELTGERRAEWLKRALARQERIRKGLKAEEPGR